PRTIPSGGPSSLPKVSMRQPAQVSGSKYLARLEHRARCSLAQPPARGTNGFSAGRHVSKTRLGTCNAYQQALHAAAVRRSDALKPHRSSKFSSLHQAVQFEPSRLSWLSSAESASYAAGLGLGRAVSVG